MKDEAEIVVEGLKSRAVFVPGNGYDSVIYLMKLGGKRAAFIEKLAARSEEEIPKPRSAPPGKR